MSNEISLPYYLQHYEITKTELTNFTQTPKTAKSLQITTNQKFMGGSSITSNKPLLAFTGTVPEYSVEVFLNAVTAYSMLSIGPEPLNTSLHQNWIHKHSVLIQTALLFVVQVQLKYCFQSYPQM